jgi:hypothetical protein
MCQGMRHFVDAHEVTNLGAVSPVMQHLAFCRGVTVPTYLLMLSRSPNLSAFIAQIIEAYDCPIAKRKANKSIMLPDACVTH